MTTQPSPLDDKGLRRFGLITGLIVVLLFAFFFPWVFDASSMPTWPWIISFLLWVPALVWPGSGDLICTDGLLETDVAAGETLVLISR